MPRNRAGHKISLKDLLPVIKIWARIEHRHKIVKQITYENDGSLKWSDFFGCLADICDLLDIATPVLLKTHIFNYAKFNRVTFLPRDFMESVDFDKLILENISVGTRK